jgi:type IV pilus assembly protein PilM
MKSNAFGLDIGATAIKAVWLNRDRNVYVYNTSLAVPSSLQLIQSDSPFDHQEMARIINKAVTDAKIGTNNVNIALPESQVFTKVIDMPVLSEKELANAIYWEAEQYIPAALDTMTLDWSILRTPKDTLSEQKMQVLLVAAPIQLVKRYQTILELAGLNLAAVETEILAVIRSIVSGDNFPTSLIINIGALNTSLSIVQNGNIVFAYVIPLGGLAMTRAIASDFGFSPEQAEEYKKTYGLSAKEFGGKVGKAIEPILTAMMTEVKKALAFYADKYKNESPISQVFLTGGSAKLSGIELYFVQTLGIETILANPWKMLKVAMVPKPIESNGPEYAVAVGLALKEYE